MSGSASTAPPCAALWHAEKAGNALCPALLQDTSSNTESISASGASLVYRPWRGKWTQPHIPFLRSQRSCIMYSWDEDTSKWYGSGAYAYAPAPAASARADAAERAKAAGPRTYGGKTGPNEKIIDPKKRIRSESKNPIIIAVDVTGSMASWPAEIFDRLPLLYNTLAQYRTDVEICFAAIGDAAVDRWPLQVTTFAGGFDLEQLLGSLYGEGQGGDAPESYGLFAHWVNTHVEAPNATETPFLIVFGDVNMHRLVPA